LQIWGHPNIDEKRFIPTYNQQRVYMGTKLVKSIRIATVAFVAVASVNAAQAGERAVIGAIIGAGAGAMIGGQFGGREGAILGGAIGAAVGTTVATSHNGYGHAPVGYRGHGHAPVVVQPAPVYHPAPVYQHPAPVYRPAPVVQAPVFQAPVVVYPQRVEYAPPVVYREVIRHPGHRHQDHGRGHGNPDCDERRGYQRGGHDRGGRFVF
jgi:hypothetical protein